MMNNYPFTTEKESMRNPFVGIPSFLMAPMCFDLDELDADIAVIGMPYDMGTSVEDRRQIRAAGSKGSFHIQLLRPRGLVRPHKGPAFSWSAVEDRRLR